MKKILTLTFVLLLIFSVCITVWSWGKKTKNVILKLAETHPADYPTTKGDYEFARLVKERTNGRITIEVYPGSQLGEEKAVIEQVQLGALDFTRVSVGPAAAFVPKLNALQLPYVYRDGDHMVKVLTGKIGQDLLKELEASQFYGIGWFDGGTRNFYTSKKQVKSLADMKGLKIRVMQSEVFVQMIEALGGVASPLPYGEVYSALQTGVIDGAENNYPSYDTASHFEVAKYYVEDGHLRVPEIIIGSKIALDKKINKSDIDILKKAAKDSLAYQMKLWQAKVKVSEDKVRANGNQISKLTPAQKKEFMDAMAPLYAKQPKEIQDLVKKIQAVK